MDRSTVNFNKLPFTCVFLLFMYFSNDMSFSELSLGIKSIFVIYRPSLGKNCAAGSFYHSLSMSELLNHNIKLVKYVRTHYRKVCDLINGVVRES